MTVVGAGSIGPGQYQYFDVILRGGTTYSIYVSPTEPGVDFDLYVYDENGNLISQDVRPNSDALCFITPYWSGPFRLIIKSKRGYSEYNVIVEP